MKIGIDLDEVLNDVFTPFLKYYNKRIGKLYKKEDLTKPNWWEIVGLSKEESSRHMNDFHEIDDIGKIKPAKEAVKSIKALIKKDELIIITARPIMFKSAVKKWIEKYFDPSIKILHAVDFHSEQGVTKAEICLELGINLILEDSELYALDCASQEINVLLFDKPWNQNITHKNIIRVKGWKDAIREINKLRKV